MKRLLLLCHVKNAEGGFRHQLGSQLNAGFYIGPTTQLTTSLQCIKAQHSPAAVSAVDLQLPQMGFSVSVTIVSVW